MRVFWIIALWSFLQYALPAYAAEAQGGPQMKDPVFPLEPHRKPSQPIQPETYIEGPSSPPPDDPASLAPIPRAHRDLNQWWHSLDFGWYLSNQNSTHSFTGASSLKIKTSNANLLSLSISYEAVAPQTVPLSGVIRLYGSTGRSEGIDQSSSITRTEFNVQDFRALAGLRIHPFSRRIKSNLAFGVDFEFGYVSILTLTQALNNIDVASRQLMLLIPRLEYRYQPNQNWYIFSNLGMGLPLLFTGESDVVGRMTRRLESELGVVRYLAKGSALGASVGFNTDYMTWSRTSLNLSDEVYSTELKLNLFWRCDI